MGKSPIFAAGSNKSVKMRNEKNMIDIHTLYQTFLASTGVTTDSRRCPAGSLFIALRGETFNGNTFAARALEAGCSYALVDDPAYAPAGDPRYLVTDNGLLTLQALARHHRRQLGTRILGITGTNGKTTTKELVACVLSQRYRTLATEGNLNNSIGVPLTLLRLRSEHELAVVEMGASHPGDIRELADIAEPDCGLITNVGKAHLEGFGSLEGVIRTKGELFDNLRRREGAFVFLHRDNPYLVRMGEGLKQVTYGCDEACDIQGRLAACSPCLSFDWRCGATGSWHHVSTRLIGSYNLPNALAAAAVGCHFGVEEALISQALGEYVPRNSRSQLMRTADNTLIIDAYNANPTSMRAAIENFAQMEAPHKMLILGDMLELGKESLSEHQEVVDYLSGQGFSDVILVGGQFAATRHACPTYPDAPSLIEALKARKPVGKTILIKGSNGVKLSAVAAYL